MSKFSNLSSKIQKEQGISKDAANAITYSIGVKKYGKAGMTKKSIAGRKKK
jgi:hypothetical protein|tara:strand:- start:4317 stop:4469 length:153 start_codon:yes stop_codon:yes gene_type:complete